MPTPTTRDYKDGPKPRYRNEKLQLDTLSRQVVNGSEVSTTSWGRFDKAIRLWEKIIGRSAPAPTTPDGENDAHRLSPLFTEFLMGLPKGWITDVGLSRKDMLKATGNGVVPQQAELALKLLLGDTEVHTYDPKARGGVQPTDSHR